MIGDDYIGYPVHPHKLPPMPYDSGLSCDSVTVRDRFAMCAMEGLLRLFAPRVPQESSAPLPASYCGIEGGVAADRLAEDAYWIADAMLNERAQRARE